MVFEASVNSAEVEIVTAGIYGIADSRIYKPDRCTEVESTERSEPA